MRLLLMEYTIDDGGDSLLDHRARATTRIGAIRGENRGILAAG